MKTLKLELDLTFSKNEPPEIKEVWNNFLVVGCRSAFKDGLDLVHQARLANIIDKMDKGNGSIELEDAEFAILKDIQLRAKFDPSYCKTVVKINERIQEANNAK